MIIANKLFIILDGRLSYLMIFMMVGLTANSFQCKASSPLWLEYGIFHINNLITKKSFNY